ncbi:unnamed protein product [Prorocentrum cordatum]|uniref:Uncharacterized protein n=1 Tax=Prorocentrum cordatum TaxID=2364126 RepID=A0ABN9QXH4_9DINO|nr:unnamed protein product [Polarella glacialis]
MPDPPTARPPPPLGMAARTPAALRQSLEAEARRLSGPRLKPRARGQPRAGSEGLDSKPADSLAEGSTVSVCVKRPFSYSRGWLDTSSLVPGTTHAQGAGWDA